MVDTASFFISIWYTPWFLKAYLTEKAPNNDLSALKEAFSIKDQYPKLGQALLKSIERHAWYLTEELVVLTIADDDVDDEVKQKIYAKLLEIEAPEVFRVGKPNLPVLSQSTELVNLVGQNSWILLNVSGVDRIDVEKWAKDDSAESLKRFKLFVKNMSSVNDCAERNIRLIQDFVAASKSEDMKQNIMQVARDSRKKCKRDLSKCQLKNV